jgi:hypothetical protein
MESTKPLSSIVKLDERFFRSARVDDPASSEKQIIYSNTIDQFLRALAAQQTGENAQGAYTWTGPYGSGKSTLARNLLSFLRSAPNERAYAASKYPAETFDLLEKAFFNGVEEWAQVAIVGSRSSFEDILVEKLTAIGALNQKHNTRGKDLISCIEKFIDHGKARKGLIVVVDEMGKFLEHAVSSDGDVYIYQLLAEAAARSNGRFILVGILHQSIQEYAATAVKTVRDEWVKVQGRFSDLSFNLNATEQIELISNVINCPLAPKHHHVTCSVFADYASREKRSISSAIKTFLVQSWPLNPLAAYLLGPISKRSYGQNQRSIFTFLSSNEPLGFRSFIIAHAIDTVPQRSFSLPELWDYLIVNWSGSISISHDSYSFNIAKEALSQLDTKDFAKSPSYKLFSDIIKSIHLLELTKQETGLAATVEILAIAVGAEKETLSHLLSQLSAARLVSVRSHNGSAFIHEGSDFDLDAALKYELENGNQVDLSRLQNEFLSSTVIAKRHYIETGCMRWADIAFIDISQGTSPIQDFKPHAGHFARFLINIGGEEDQVEEYVNNSVLMRHFAVGHLQVSSMERETIREFIALSRISESRAELSKDRVARREVYDRLDLRRQQVENLLDGKVHELSWDVPALDRTAVAENLSQLASDIADELFEDAPMVKNELINRSKVSGNATRATKQFLYDLINHEGAPNLGYSGYPPERAIFETILMDFKIYFRQTGSWLLHDPRDVKGDKAQRLALLFTVTLSFLKRNKDRQVQLSEIYEKIWSQPPFGIKSGIYPVFSFIFIKIHGAQVIYYQDGVFTPSLTEIDVDYIVRSPRFCTVRYLDSDASTKVVLDQLMQIPVQLGQARPYSSAPLDIARSLIAVFDQVPPWSRKTSRVSSDAKIVRGLFARAIDPAQFTLFDIPNLFGQIDQQNSDDIASAISRIVNALSELLERQTNLLREFQRHLMEEIGSTGCSAEHFSELNARAVKVMRMAGDNRMETFISNLAQLDGDLSSIEKMASFLLNKPSRLWIDNDADRLFIEATAFARGFNVLETMVHIKGRRSSRHALSLVYHSRAIDAVNRMDVEFTDVELIEAKALTLKISHHFEKEKSSMSRKQLIAALSLLLQESSDE